MKRKRNLLIAAPFFAAVIMPMTACQGMSGYSTREVEIRQFVDLSRFKDIIKGGWIISRSSISLDARGNIYLLDGRNHRIIIINGKGEDIGQIGQIGQDKESLYHPMGICIDNGEIYVLNRNGEEIKAFTLDNHFLYSLALDDSWTADSLSMNGGCLFIAERSADRRAYNQTKLITVRGKDGNRVGGIGRIIPCASHVGYLEFNRIYFQFMDHKIMGTHRFAPVLFAYDVDGREIYYKKLNSLVPEMEQLDERAKEMNLDTPDTHKEEDEYSSRNLLYCYGFGVDRKQQIHYAMSIFDAKNEANNRYFVIRLDQSGNAVEKIIYKYHGRPLQVGPIVANQKYQLFAVGFYKEKVYFFPM